MQNAARARSVRHDAFAVDGRDRYHGCPTCMPPTATGRSGEDEGVVQLQLVEAEKRALDLIEVRGLVPFRHVLLARERKQVLVLGPEGERLPLADGGQPQVPVPKSFVTNLSPIFAGRERTLCKL